MKRDLRKPGYRLTRQAIWSSFVLAWLVILLLVMGALAGRQGAIDIAPVALPSMVMIVAALLGIHRAFGSMDMRTIAEAGPPDAARDLAFERRIPHGYTSFGDAG